MKIEMCDRDGTKVIVGYEYIPNDELGYDEPLFFIETNYETVTLVMGKSDLTRLSNVINFLRDGI